MDFIRVKREICLGLALLLLIFTAAAYADNVLEVETERDMVIWGNSDFAKLGQSMAIGDFNGDGIDDVAIGSPQQHSADGTINDVGFVSVMFGSSAFKNSDGKVTPDNSNPSMEGVRIFGATEFSYVGQLLAAGDLNNDGKADLVIVSQYRNNKYNLTRVYVVYGKSSFNPKELRLPDNADVVMQRDESRISSLAIGDVNGDHIDDLVLCDNRKERVYILYGSASKWNASINLATDSNVVITRNGGTGGTLNTGDLFYSNAESALGDLQGVAIGDVNKDGIGDIIIGVPKEDTTGRTNGGVVYVFYGKSNFTQSLDITSANVRIRGSVANDQAGASLAVGDINGDGYGDIIIGAPESMMGVSGSTAGVGKVQVVYGGASMSAEIDLLNQANITLNLSEAVRNIGDKTGYAVAAKDINGDGKADIVISSPWAKKLTDANGWVHIVYGGTALKASYELDREADIRILAPDPTADLARGLMGTSFGIGDLNADGKKDIIIGAPEGIFGTSKGFAGIIFDAAAKAVMQGISGTVTTSLTGQTAGIKDAKITITENGKTAYTDGNGYYAIPDVPVGAYTVKIEKNNFGTITMNVSVSHGNMIDLSKAMTIQTSCDSNGDSKTGLEDVIYILQILAGLRP